MRPSRAWNAANSGSAAGDRGVRAPTNTMDSNSRHTLFRGENFRAQERAYADQPAHKMPHSSIRPGRRPLLPNQTFPFQASTETFNAQLSTSSDHWRAIQYRSRLS